MSHLIAIDPGSEKFGVAVFNSLGHLLHHETIKLIPLAGVKGRPSIDLRIAEIGRRMDQILTTYPCSNGAIEEAFVGKNVKSALVLGMARGALMLTMAQRGISIREYPALTVKKYGAGLTKASKEDVMHNVKLIYNLDDVTEDAADAIAVGRTHLLLNSNTLSDAMQQHIPEAKRNAGAYRTSNYARVGGRGKKSNSASRSAFEAQLRDRGLIN